MNYLDMLAKLGIGSAHPGGFAATLALIGSKPIAAGSRILEVGCGTGRTACYLAKQGYDVTAVDIRTDMLVKANYRAELEGVGVRFLEGNVEELPFTDDSFNVVLAESVTIFAETGRALKEYNRVLAPGGALFDREMIAVKPISANLEAMIRDYYGVDRVWTVQEWTGLIEEAGFAGVELLQRGVLGDFDWQDEMQHPDNSGVADPSVYFDERIWTLTRQYDEIMLNYGDHFGFGVWTGIKPG